MSQHNDRQLHFAEIEIGSEAPETSIPIPPRAPSATFSTSSPQARTIPPTVSSALASYKSREQEFTEQARELADRTEEEAEFVPFMSYWPTYDHMSGLQRKWYFYWRGEVRAQRYPDTDLSYVFLYVYELLNGVGWSEPEEGCRLLAEIWLQYRGRYPKLDSYLSDWLADFVRVHQLGISLLSLLFTHEPHRMSNDLLELELMERWREDIVRLPFKRLLRLLDYDVCASKYYAGEGRRWLEEFLPKVVALADAYVRKQQGMSILGKYPPEEPERRDKYLFRNAVYDSFLFGRTITVPMYRISSQPSLRAWMTQLVRLTENKLRELTGARGRLRDIHVEPELARLVERYLEREVDRITKEERLRNRPAIVIDEERLVQLQQDSEQVRDMLSTEEVQEEILRQNSDAALDANSSHEAGTRNEQVPEARNVACVFELDQSVEIPLECSLELEQLPHSDEVSLPIGGAVSSEPTQMSEGREELPGEWQILAQMLSEVELKVLCTILEGAGSAAISQIAEEQGSMPELLIDRINEAGMECIGDLLIDGDELIEEYMPMVEVLTIVYRRRM